MYLVGQLSGISSSHRKLNYEGDAAASTAYIVKEKK